MRLIEKSCPNCGAGIKFDENDKTCKCEYCNREFEIERNNNEKKQFDSNDFNLNEMKPHIKAFFGAFAITSIAMTIIGFIMFIAILIFFIFIVSQMINM